jgi:Secretion system C-terminal sorting domain
MKQIFTIVLLLVTCIAQAQFKANNLAVLKITSPTAIGNVGIAYSTSVVEYSTAGVATTTKINLTGGTPNFVVEERSIAHEGQLNLSGDGRFLTAVGYNAAPGGAAAAIRALDKRVARINAAGLVDLSTSVKPTHSFGGVGVRSAITENGTSYLINSSAASTVHGVRKVTHGEDTAISYTASQYRALGRFGGVVYGSSLNSPKMFSHDAAGTPTELAFDGIAGAEYSQFLFLDSDPAIPGNDLLYIADRNSGVRKLFLAGAIWKPVSDSSGLYNPTFGGTSGFFALTGKIEGGKPTLYGVKINVVGGVYTSSHLVKIVDNAARNADWNLAANAPTATELAATDNKEQFKGVCFTPQGSTPVNDVAESENPLIIRPTLTRDNLTIEVGEKMTPLSIFAISGQTVLSIQAQNDQQVNVSNLPSGTYIVRTGTGKVGRFVKQ